MDLNKRARAGWDETTIAVRSSDYFVSSGPRMWKYYVLYIVSSVSMTTYSEATDLYYLCDHSDRKGLLLFSRIAKKLVYGIIYIYL